MSRGTPTRILVLGAGFGGLELATRLSESVPDKVHVTLIDKNDAFMFGFSKLDVLVGRKSISWRRWRTEIAHDCANVRIAPLSVSENLARRSR